MCRQPSPSCRSFSSATSSASRDAKSRAAPSRRSSSSSGIDFVIANVENSAAGFGVTGDIADTILGYGVDVMTSGNHVWDKKEVLEYIPRQPRLLRPANFPAGVPAAAASSARTRTGEPVGVLNLMGRVFMTPLDDPFALALREIEALRAQARVIFVDFHAEATSEKIAMGWHLDGRVTAVVGTHTHVQTADERILPKGTAYLTDAGMTGPHDSIIGVTMEAALGRFVNGDAGEVRGGHRPRTAERGHRHGRSAHRPRDRDRAPESVGRRGRGARGDDDCTVARLTSARRAPSRFDVRSLLAAVRGRSTRRRAPRERRDRHRLAS